MKKDYSALELLGAIVLTFAIGIPLSFYAAWVMLKIIEWFAIPVNLNVMQMFGINQIVALWTYTETKSSDDSSFSKSFGKLFTRAALMSLILLIMYIVHVTIK